MKKIKDLKNGKVPIYDPRLSGQNTKFRVPVKAKAVPTGIRLSKKP